jgi:hypothetical protein
MDYSRLKFGKKHILYKSIFPCVENLANLKFQTFLVYKSHLVKALVVLKVLLVSVVLTSLVEKFQLIPTVQPIKTNKDGIGDFGIFTVSCGR